MNLEGRGPQSTPTGEAHDLEARPSFGWQNNGRKGQEWGNHAGNEIRKIRAKLRMNRD